MRKYQIKNNALIAEVTLKLIDEPPAFCNHPN